LSREIDRAPFGWINTNTSLKVTAVSQHKDMEYIETIVAMNEKEIYADFNDSGMRISGKRLPDI
jgi:predicted class III extradiol MEMO1 family dioxygenase